MGDTVVIIVSPDSALYLLAVHALAHFAAEHLQHLCPGRGHTDFLIAENEPPG